LGAFLPIILEHPLKNLKRYSLSKNKLYLKAVNV
jgi:hypothetical protein